MQSSGVIKLKKKPTMYENLLRLPYFQGMDKDNITSILDKVTFEFINYGDGDIVFRRGEKCDKFVVLTQGTLTSRATSPDNTYNIEEELAAPYAIEPYSLFGYSTIYRRDYIAKGNCSILVIDKQYLFTEFTKHHIFTINLLNLISRKAQKLRDGVWQYTPTTLNGRIVHFIATRCDSLKGTKQVKIKMERLATLLCETRLNISKALNDMQSAGYVELHRGGITVPAIEKLIVEIE